MEERVKDLLTHQSTTTKTSYDSLDRPNCIEHVELGTAEKLTYDAADRVIERKVVGTDGTLLSMNITSYDLAGRVVEEGVGRAGTIARTTTTYGAYGLPSEITYPDGTKTTFSYNPLYRWTDGHTYFQKITTDARGVVVEELLDSNDQARSLIVKDPFGTVISNRTVTFSILGKPAVIEDHEIASGQEKSVVRTRLDYDSVGQMIVCTLGEGTPDSATWRYSYDPEGRKIEEVKPSGIVLSSSYDAKGRLASFISSDGTIAWSYSYNVQDLPETITNEVSGDITRRSYNGLGMVVGESLENGQALSFDVLPTGQLSAITYPDGSHANYDYLYGQLSSIERNGYEYRVNTRDLSGMITNATLPGSTGQVVQAIDEMGRRTLISHPAFEEERTVFDPIGCCLERIIDGQHEVFSYDFLSQLTSDNGRSASYDSLHRRLETEGKTATHNARHQVLSQGERVFHYDIDGRRTDDDRYTYAYDACDRLIAVDDGVSRYEYAYDPFNRRLSATTYAYEGGIWKVVSLEKFLWHGDCEIGSIDEESNIKTLRILGEGLGGEIGAAVAFEVNGEVFVPIHDLSGHVRACLNMDGEVVDKLAYTAFGLESRTAEITPWTFSSKRQDAETGFLYFGRRFYESSTATWLTQDPLGHSAGPNLYAYVKNNPLSCVDIYGLIETEDDCNGIIQHSYVISDKGIWRDDQVGRENVPHIELTQNTWTQVFEKYSFSKFNVNAHTNGILTTCREARDRQERIYLEFKEKYNDAMVLYNPTHGFLADAYETLCNILGIETEVVKDLRGQFEYGVDKCKENNVALSADVCGHSQGAAINVNVFDVEDFGAKGTYSNVIENMATFGGISIDPLAENYIQNGDIVPFMNPFNWDKLSSENVHFVDRHDDSLLDAHNFDGEGYHRAMQDFVQHTMVEAR